jgi:hypothetical protein
MSKKPPSIFEKQLENLESITFKGELNNFSYFAEHIGFVNQIYVFKRLEETFFCSNVDKEKTIEMLNKALEFYQQNPTPPQPLKEKKPMYKQLLHIIFKKCFLLIICLVVLIILSVLSQVEARSRVRVMPKARKEHIERSIRPLGVAMVATGVIIHGLSNPKRNRGAEYGDSE